MIRNYFKIAWRNLKRNKAYAFISVTGLTLSITCSLLIFTLISYHLSFDNFHHHANRIYRFYTEWHDESVKKSGAIPQPLAKAFRDNFTLAEKTARIIGFSNTLITITENKDVKKFNEEEGVAFTEPEFFDIMNFPLIQGNKKTVLVKNNEAIITEKIACKYFGTGNPIGKVIRLNNKLDFTITGVLKNLPSNTDRKEEIYVSYSSLAEYTNKQNQENWDGVYGDSEGFTLLKPGITLAQADNALAQLVKMHYTGRYLKVWHFKLEPLANVHFNPELDGYADKKYIWALFFIGLFLIVTACLNFVNLATAQALNRSKEIGVRKVLGSLPRHLFWQFIAETAIITLASVIVALGLAQLSLPFVNDLFHSKMLFKWPQLSVFIIGIAVVVVFLSGSYPGLVLAKFQPIAALKNKLSQKDVGGFSLRRVLVVVQFSISQVLIIGTIIVITQLHYTQTTDLGFNKNAIVLLRVPQKNLAKLSSMYNSISQLKGVEKISYCYRPPAAESNNAWDIRFDHRSQSEHWNVNMKMADVNYLSTFDIKLVSGRNFFASDTTREVLVNETFCRRLNLSPQEILGKVVSINNGVSSVPIVGVVKDFYNNSFHKETSAVCIMPSYRDYSTCAVKISMANTAATLAALQQIWNNNFPDEVYSYQFFDASIARFYETDAILLKLVEVFAAIAVLIGCLGLYGLVSFMAARKTKEIGIRKVLGATIQHILWLFGKEFCRLLLIAFFIAAPLAWWVMSNYLQDFKYRISIGPGIFLTAILSTFIIALITIGYRASATAIANPIKSLRNQ